MATTRCGPRRPPPAPRSQRDTLSTDEPALAQLAAGQACRWPRVWGQSPARPRGPRSRPALCAAPSPRTRACRTPHVPEALGARAGVCSTGASPELLPLLDTSSTLCAGPAPAGALDTARKPQPRPELRASVLRDRRTRATGSHWRRGSSDYSSPLTLTGPASCSLVPGGGPSAGRRGAGHTLSSGSPSAPSAATDACVPGHVPQTGGRRGAQAWTVGRAGPWRPLSRRLDRYTEPAKISDLDGSTWRPGAEPQNPHHFAPCRKRLGFLALLTETAAGSERDGARSCTHTQPSAPSALSRHRGPPPARS